MVDAGSVWKGRKIRRKHLRKYSWLPDVFRLKGSIIARIVGPVLTVTIWAALVTYAWSRGQKVLFPNSVLPLLSVVVGLVLVFSTSYERYWEGRKSFAAVTSNIRNICRAIWINVAPPPTTEQPPHIKGKTPITNVTPLELRRRKTEALKLALSFAVAVKHYLRGEDGIHWDDYTDLPPFFSRYDEHEYALATATTPPSFSARSEGLKDDSNPSGRNSPEAADQRRSAVDATKRVRAKRSKVTLSGAMTPLLGAHRIDMSGPPTLSMPLPLIIAHELSKAIFKFRRDGFLETVGPAGANALSQLVHGMVDQLAAMERVANTPIPLSYGIHLKQCVTLYLFALPFTLISDLGWATVPVVTVVAFTFMGIEGIADEIEMPFGYDSADLPLDLYCNDLKEEIHYIIEKLPEGGEGRHGYDDGEGDD